MIEADIAAALSPLAPTTSFGRADKTQRPRITHQRATGSQNANLGGAGVNRVRFQIDVWADTPAQARGLAEQAKVALRAGLTVSEIFDNPDDFEEDTLLHRASFDAAIWF